ncbi:hypothetical protein CO2235_70062 [Cupriavidus oxalaticus]|uniref:Uncharacterized protein n=1 Tax=Cupriavidus oxalaticus TaxID=96344 RepID=A0A375GE31_9BURK|nr:hypothetical protein CO2235_70062 [Cupriavidus oxalaticus]
MRAIASRCLMADNQSGWQAVRLIPF